MDAFYSNQELMTKEQSQHMISGAPSIVKSHWAPLEHCFSFLINKWMENKTQNIFSNIKYTFPNVVLTINMFIKCMLETSQAWMLKHLTMIVKYLSTLVNGMKILWAILTYIKDWQYYGCSEVIHYSLMWTIGTAKQSCFLYQCLQ